MPNLTEAQLREVIEHNVAQRSFRESERARLQRALDANAPGLDGEALQMEINRLDTAIDGYDRTIAACKAGLNELHGVKSPELRPSDMQREDEPERER
jgi:hypothetical protein